MKSRMLIAIMSALLLAFSLSLAHPGKATKKAKKATGSVTAVKATTVSEQCKDDMDCADMAKSGKCTMKSTSSKMDCCAMKKTSDSKTDNTVKSDKSKSTAKKENN